MTERLRAIEKRRSLARTRLAEIRAMSEADTTDEIRAEGARIEQEELVGTEPELRAAIDEAKELDGDLRRTQIVADGETAEIRQLRSQTRMGDYVAASSEQRGAMGAALEFNQALNIPSNYFPMMLLAPEPALEMRAETDADGRANQAMWIDRLFAETLSRYLGVTYRSVEPGTQRIPVTSAGGTPAMKAREEAAGDSAWAITTEEHKPKRLPVTLVFPTEDAFRLPMLEPALVRELRMSVMEKMDAIIFSGDTAADGTDADIKGLKTIADVEEVTLTQAKKIVGADVLAAFVGLVDGLHASSMSDLRAVFSVGANTLWGSTVLPAPVTTGETIAQYISRAGLTWRTRAGIDTATANADFGAYIGRQRGIEGAGTASVWSAGELIRDRYQGAAAGTIRLTFTAFWDFSLPRASNFARLKFVT